jgi:hypothetical protein
MKKLYLFLVSMMTFSSFFAANNTSLSSIKMTFAIAKNAQTWGSDIVEKDVQDCINYLKQLADVQKKRKLTLEEITLALHAAIYILSAEYEYHSGQITIAINEKEKLTLPFSSETLLNLLAQSAQIVSKDAEKK